MNFGQVTQLNLLVLIRKSNVLTSAPPSPLVLGSP